MENVPSFYVNDNIGIHDFGTDKHYSVISFVMELFNISYISAIKRIILDFNIKKEDLDSINNTITISQKLKTTSIVFQEAKKPQFIECYFDVEEFDSKPNDSISFAKIKNRICQNEFTRYKNIQEIAEEFMRGKTCIPSAIKNNVRENWKKQQVFLLDFDNKINSENINCYDNKHVSEEMILEYCKKNKLLPTIIYNTFSHSEEQHKFRLVYVLEEALTEIDIAKALIEYLLKKFKYFNPDISKKNLSDMFLGGKNIYYIGENYYKVKIK